MPAFTIDSTLAISANDSTARIETPVLISRAHDDEVPVQLIEKGRASWYGPKFNGKLTANGEQYDMYAMTAAHRTLPFNTLVLVKDLDSGKSTLVRINDRGPFAKNRIIDLSKKAAQKLGMIGHGTAHVKLFVPKGSLERSTSTHLAAATYTVQLGSFKKEARAFNYSSKIKGSRVEIIRKNGRAIYRVYFGLYINKQEAVKKKRQLTHQNYACFVKQIENG